MNVDVEAWVRKVAKAARREILDEARERMAAAWDFRPVDRPPISISCPPPEPWPTFTYAETFVNPAKMLISQLAPVYSHCLLGDDGVPCVRANYGVGIVPSGFGAEIVVREGHDQMPWVKKPFLNGDPPDLSKLCEPDPREDGLMARVIETEEFFADQLEGTGISVYLCDTQGPLDIAYLIRGPKLFKDFRLHPQFAHGLLRMVAKTYVEFSKIQKEVVGEPMGQGVHGTPNVLMARGGVRLCEDVAVMLGPEHYSEFCTPVNELCLRDFDGGMGHYCVSDTSNGKQILHSVLSNRLLRAFFFGGPSKLYEFKETYDLFREKRVCLVWTEGPQPGQKPSDWVATVTNELDETTGLVFSIGVQSFEVARDLLELWRRTF